MEFSTKICIEGGRVGIFSEGDSAPFFTAGEGAASFLRLSLQDVNFLYNDVITSAIGVSESEAQKYALWSKRKLSAIERECGYMTFYNNIFKSAVYDYLTSKSTEGAKRFADVIKELNNPELLEYINSDIDEQSRDAVLESFANQRTFDTMTTEQKNESLKALMYYLYFRDAILFNIKALRKSVKGVVKALASGDSKKAFSRLSRFSYLSECEYNERSGAFFETIRIDKPSLLAEIEFSRLAGSGGTFKVCENCGSYFLPVSRSDSIYCRYVDKVTGKTCYQTGASAKQREKIGRNPAHREFNRAYKKYFARVRSGKMTETEFELWKENARVMRDRCETGEIELSELIAQLDKNL